MKVSQIQMTTTRKARAASFQIVLILLSFLPVWCLSLIQKHNVRPVLEEPQQVATNTEIAALF